MALLPENDSENKPRRRRWLYPFDVVALIIFSFILVGIFGTGGSHSGLLAKRKIALLQIGAFSTALDMFKLENGFCPAGTNGLNDLVLQPTNASTNWHQYLDRVPLDPWGHPYLYVSPGQHRTNSYDLSSAGPDGIPGTQDDIVNW